MHKNFLIFFILFLLIITTSLVIIFKPKTHKPIVFENRDFKLELISQSAEVNIPKTEVNIEIEAPKINIETPVINVKVENPEINVTTKEVKTEKSTKQNTVQNKTQTKPQSQNKNTPQKTAQNTSAQKNKTAQTQKVPSNNNNTDTKQTKTEQQKTEIQTAVIPDKPKEQNKTETVVLPKTEQQPTVKEQKVQETKPVTAQQNKMTEEELEIIAWNKWRSDLQNQLMRDSKISAPIGTRFMFSFTVDKFGTITNLKTWSSNPSYTPLAVKVIKPILLGYQGKAILNFPANSKRITTNVDGGFTMAYSSNYSKPSDYNDYERVKK